MVRRTRRLIRRARSRTEFASDSPRELDRGSPSQVDLTALVAGAAGFFSHLLQKSRLSGAGLSTDDAERSTVLGRMQQPREGFLKRRQTA